MTNLETLLLAMLGNKGGGGEGGTTNYNELDNRPQVNGITLTGNKDSEDLNLVDIDMIGVSYGVAALDEEGKVPESQLPPYPNYDTKIQNINKALDQKVDETELLSTISASSTTQIRDSKTVEFDGTGKNLEKLVLEGKTNQDGTPSPSAPVEVKGVGDKCPNLALKTNYVGGYLDDASPITPYRAANSFTVNDSSSVTIDTTTASTGISCPDYIKVEPNTTYYVHFKATLSNVSLYVLEYDNNSSGYKHNYTNLKSSGFFTTKSTTQYIRYSLINSIVGTNTFSEITIVESNKAVDFVNALYKIPISVGGKSNNIYLNAPLFNGETVDATSGVANKKYGMYVLTGNETFASTSVDSNLVQYSMDKPSDIAPTSGYGQPAAWCSIATRQSSSAMSPNIIGFGNKMGFVVNKSEFASDTAFKEHLTTLYNSGNPAVVVYQLATPTKEPFDAPEISTVVGKNTLSVDTEVTPAKVEVTSFGEYYSKSEVDKMLALRDAISVDASEAITSKLGGSSYLFDAATITFANATYSNHQVSISFRLKGTVKSAMKTSNYAFITVLGAIDSNIPKPKTQVWGVAAQFSKSNNFISSINTDGVVMVQTPGGTIADISDDTDLVITLSYMV